MTTPQSYPLAFECGICLFSSTTQTDLDKHMETHDEKAYVAQSPPVGDDRLDDILGQMQGYIDDDGIQAKVLSKAKAALRAYILAEVLEFIGENGIEEDRSSGGVTYHPLEQVKNILKSEMRAKAIARFGGES